jgi:hypothetical protein
MQGREHEISCHICYGLNPSSKSYTAGNIGGLSGDFIICQVIVVFAGARLAPDVHPDMQDHARQSFDHSNRHCENGSHEIERGPRSEKRNMGESYSKLGSVG